MKTLKLTLGSMILVTLLAASGAAQQRTFVSGLGSDGNPCSRTAPCRTFGTAITATNAGGEVVVHPPGGLLCASRTRLASSNLCERCSRVNLSRSSCPVSPNTSDGEW
jgi:hypothetical protein